MSSFLLSKLFLRGCLAVSIPYASLTAGSSNTAIFQSNSKPTHLYSDAGTGLFRMHDLTITNHFSISLLSLCSCSKQMFAVHPSKKTSNSSDKNAFSFFNSSSSASDRCVLTISSNCATRSQAKPNLNSSQYESGSFEGFDP